MDMVAPRVMLGVPDPFKVRSWVLVCWSFAISKKIHENKFHKKKLKSNFIIYILVDIFFAIFSKMNNVQIAIFSSRHQQAL